jgi:Flp pilus assembly protein TadG
MIFRERYNTAKNLWSDQRGLAFTESALILPIMLVVLFGMFDLGQAMIINQKITSAAHIASDLITRKPTITQADLDDAIGGAQLVIDPYNRDNMGVDIAGIKFDDEDSPNVIWRHTHNMSPHPSIPNDADGLGLEGEGVVAVIVTYSYTPKFSGAVFNEFEMRETAFLRGRRTSVVKMEEE